MDTTTIAWAHHFRNLIFPGQFIYLTGMPFDMARNVAAMRAIECGAEYLFFLDSDVCPPPDAVLRLLARKQPLISGVYFRRSPPVGVPVMMKNGDWYRNYPRGQVVEVDLVGAGCMLIHREILEKLKPQRPEAGKHWFDWRVDMKGIAPDGACLSEDFTFNLAVKHQLGIPTLVDTSVCCKHVGLAEAFDNTFGPVLI